MTYLHTLDADSPFADNLDDLRLAPGNLIVWIQGYDEVLKTSICNRAVYPLRSVGYGRWCEVIQKMPGWQQGRSRSWRLLLREWRPGNLSTEHAIDMRKFDLLDEAAHPRPRVQSRQPACGPRDYGPQDPAAGQAEGVAARVGLIGGAVQVPRRNAGPAKRNASAAFR